MVRAVFRRLRRDTRMLLQQLLALALRLTPIEQIYCMQIYDTVGCISS